MRTLPRLRIAHLPTPVEMLPRLSASLGGPNLLIKRDDLTGLAFGGNKTRKLELLVSEAKANGAEMLITAGAAQSNHCRQTAAAAARFGFACRLVLALAEGETADQIDHPSGNLRLDKLLGAEMVWTDFEHRDQVLKETFDQAWMEGKRPYLIPYGGSNAVGASAYAFAIKELLDQGHRPDWIVFPSSSGGTQAGMVLGARLYGFTGRVLGISVDERAQVLKERVAGLATEAAEHLGEKLVFQPDEIQVDDHYLGAGYGIPSEAEREALALFARTEAILLDPVYTARAAAGLIDLIRSGLLHSGQSVLFWHTGGTPALFADRYRDL
jgi:D-cysteine desulfhydrase family pyridoxal phosphate-dependent enzyme